MMSADVADAPEPGLVLRERYRLFRPLDSGGMGNVWAAHDVSLDIDVAIKFMNVPREAGAAKMERELAIRLVHEARVIAQLKHPAIVNVSDVAQTEWGQPFVVMELLEGEDLGHLLTRTGPLPPEDAVRYMLPIAQALMLAHDKGVVHRDLKPGNIFLAKRDDGTLQPKLLDFGVAKSDRKERKHVTQAGMMVGSPAYMSPEQVQGEEADVRSDIWSFCMTLYELLSGKLPFDRPTHIATSLAILSEEIEPLSREQGIDEKLSNVVLRGLNKEIGKRWPDFPALGRALADWLAARGITHDASGTALALWNTVSPTPSDRPVTAVAGNGRKSHAAPIAISVVGLVAFAGLALMLANPSNTGSSEMTSVETASSTEIASASAAPEPTAPASTAAAPTPTPTPTPTATATSTATTTAAATTKPIETSQPVVKKEEPRPRPKKDAGAPAAESTATAPETDPTPPPEPAPAPAPEPPGREL